MNTFKYISFFLAFSLFVSCATPIETTDSTPIVTKTLYVAAETKTCTGVGEMECLLVKTDKNQAEWEYFYSNIQGFNYQKGYEFELLIQETKVENPPADASNIKYTLVEIISKTKKSN